MKTGAKKGILRIVFGFILFIIQSFGWYAGLFSNTENILYDFFYNFGSATIGALLIAFGIKAFYKKERATIILHSYTKTFCKIINFVFLILFFIRMLTSVFSLVYDFTNNFTVLSILNLLFYSFVIIYLLFYINKKPSVLFSTALIIDGIINIYSFVSAINLSSVLFNGTFFFVFNEIILLILAGIEIFFAIIFYNENFSKNLVLIFSWCLLSLFLANYILTEILYFLNLQSFLIITNPLGAIFSFVTPAFLFIYTAIIKPSNDMRIVDISQSTSNQSTNAQDDIILPIDIPSDFISCHICGADVTSDNEHCHVCGTKKL